MNGRPIYEGRMFFGDCLPDHSNSAVWFQRWLGDDKQWHKDVFVAHVRNDALVEQELHGDSLKDAEAAVRSGKCQEVPGINRNSEP